MRSRCHACLAQGFRTLATDTATPRLGLRLELFEFRRSQCNRSFGLLRQTFTLLRPRRLVLRSCFALLRGFLLGGFLCTICTIIGRSRRLGRNHFIWRSVEHHTALAYSPKASCAKA